MKASSVKKVNTEVGKQAALTAEVFNFKNEKTGTIELPKEVFEVKWNPILVKQVLLAQLANKRVPWAHAKDRSEVRGGGKKPWRQKGTGRARHGSIRSPLWVGGGKAHGPNKERDYTQKVNKKMKKIAILSVLSKKLKDGQVKFFESMEIAEPKTKILVSSLSPIMGKAKKLDLLMIPDVENKKIFRASRNIEKTKALNPESLNVYDLMNFKQIFIDQKAVSVIGKHYSTTK